VKDAALLEVAHDIPESPLVRSPFLLFSNDIQLKRRSGWGSPDRYSTWGSDYAVPWTCRISSANGTSLLQSKRTYPKMGKLAAFERGPHPGDEYNTVVRPASLSRYTACRCHLFNIDIRLSAITSDDQQNCPTFPRFVHGWLTYWGFQGGRGRNAEFLEAYVRKLEGQLHPHQAAPIPCHVSAEQPSTDQLNSKFSDFVNKFVLLLEAAGLGRAANTSQRSTAQRAAINGATFLRGVVFDEAAAITIR
jgi:hypothetical protein